MEFKPNKNLSNVPKPNLLKIPKGHLFDLSQENMARLMNLFPENRSTTRKRGSLK